MDKASLKQAIAHLESEKIIHDEKFAGRPEHSHCAARFEKVLDGLYADLEKMDQKRIDFSVSISALPDAINTAYLKEEMAKEMAKEIAKDLEISTQGQVALELKRQAQAALFKELNELDGFDR